MTPFLFVSFSDDDFVLALTVIVKCTWRLTCDTLCEEPHAGGSLHTPSWWPACPLCYCLSLNCTRKCPPQPSPAICLDAAVCARDSTVHTPILTSTSHSPSADATLQTTELIVNIQQIKCVNTQQATKTHSVNESINEAGIIN